MSEIEMTCRAKFVNVLALAVALAGATVGHSQTSSQGDFVTHGGGLPISLPVSFALDYYLSVAFANGSTALTLTVSDGGQAGSYTTSGAIFSIITNDATAIKASLTTTGFPGTWASQVSKDGTTWIAGATGYSSGTGTSSGYLRGYVSGLSPNTAIPGNYTGTATLTFAQL